MRECPGLRQQGKEKKNWYAEYFLEGTTSKQTITSNQILMSGGAMIIQMSISQSYEQGEIEEESEERLSRPKRQCKYVPGAHNGKWSLEEHMRYIVFIDFNKEKMRSKEKRRSNKFYKEMASFISTRNALQCRSHHQKLEEKYSYVNKIISLFKKTFDRVEYRALYELLAKEVRNPSFTQDKHSVETATQTDVQGIQLNFVMLNPSTILMHLPPQIPSAQFYPSMLQMPPMLPNDFFWPSNFSQTHFMPMNNASLLKSRQ